MGKIERGLMKLTRAELIEIFKNGNIPQGSDYEALFNSIYLLDEGKYITGYTQQEIDDMIAPLNAMKDEGYVFAGIAHPSDQKKEHKAKVFYYATEVGDYKGFLDSGGQYIKKANHGVSVLKQVSVGVWEIEDVMVIAQELGENESKIVSQKGIRNSLEYKRLLPSDFSIFGYIDARNGEVTSASTLKCTDFIPIEKFKIVYCKALLGDFCSLFALYDNEKKFINTNDIFEMGKINERLLMIQDYPNAKYIRFTCSVEYLNNMEFILSRNNIDSIIFNKLTYLNVDESFFKISGYIQIDGEVHGASTLKCTDFIRLNDSKIIHYDVSLGSNTVPCAFYDENKSLIAYEPYEDNIRNVKNVILSKYPTAKYVRFSCKTDYLSECNIMLSKSLFDEKFDIEIKEIQKNTNIGFDEINQWIAKNYLYGGIISPNSTPIHDKAKAIYLANSKGVYTNFGSIEVFDGEICIIAYDGNKWLKEVIVIAKQSRKILKDVDFTTYGFVDNKGVEQPASTLKYTDFILLEDTFVHYDVSLNGGQLPCAFYDENKNFIAGSPFESGINKGTIKVKDYIPNAKYIKFTCKVDYFPTMSIYFSNDIENLLLGEIIELDKTIKEIQSTVLTKRDIVGSYTNLDFVEKGYFNTEIGIFQGSNNVWATDYIPIRDNREKVKLTARVGGEKNAIITGWDENKQYVKSYLMGGTYIDKEMILDTSDVKYLRFSSWLQVEGSEAYFHLYSPFEITTKEYVDAKVIGSSSRYINVKSFGALGNGVSDDTEALENAFKKAKEDRMPIYFPSGVYMIRRSLTMMSGIEIFGNNATIKKQKAVTTTLVEDVLENQEFAKVVSAKGFNVGDQIFLAPSNKFDGAAARYSTPAIVTSVDLATNTINFKSCFDSIKVGAIQNYPAGYYVSSSFAILRTWSQFDDCIGAYVHDLILDGNRQEDEKPEWSNGCIHVDASRAGSVDGIPFNRTQKDFIFKNLTILNSPYDGISDQGESGTVVDNCVIKNPYKHGIHFGTGYHNGKVLGCSFENTANGAGVFWCAGVCEILVNANYFKGCLKGCSSVEYANRPTNSIITNNVFMDIVSTIIDFQHKDILKSEGGIIISNNVINILNAPFVKCGNFTELNISNNIIRSASSQEIVAIECANSSKVVLLGNLCPTLTTPTNLSGTTELVNVNNSWNL